MTVCVPVTPPGSSVAETLYARITSAPGLCACMLDGVAALGWSDALQMWVGTMTDGCDEALTWTVKLRWVVGSVFSIYFDRDDACFAAWCTATATDTDPVTIQFTNFNVPRACCSPDDPGAPGLRESLVVTIGEVAPTITPPASHPEDHTGETSTLQRHCKTAFAANEDGLANSDCTAAPPTWTAYAVTSEIGTPLCRLGVPGAGLRLGVPPDPDAVGVAALDLAATAAIIPPGGETCWLHVGGFDFSGLEDVEGWDAWKIVAYITLYSDSPDVHCTGLQLAKISGGTITRLGDDLSSHVPSDLTYVWTEATITPVNLWGLLELPYTDRSDMEAALAHIRDAGFGLVAKFENEGADTAAVYIDAVQQGACVQRGYPNCTYGDTAQTKVAGTADGDSLCECSVNAWALPGSVYAGDEDTHNSAQVTLPADEDSCWLVSRHHDFDLPAEATAITAVTLQFLAKAAAADSIVLDGCQLSDGTTLIGNDQAPTDIDESIGTEWRWYTFGFTDPLWGLTSEDLLAIVNEIGFGAGLKFRNNGNEPATVYVNQIQMAVCS